MEEIEKLKEEATSLGISFSPNIGAAKLQEKIDQYYESIDEDSKDVPSVQVKAEVVNSEPDTPRVAAMKAIREQEKRARETRIVKITMVDKRESSFATHAYFSSGGIQMNVPLDIFVEMPRLLINQAEKAKALVHIESKGKTEHKLQKKYVVEYMK
jgi:hypothetical protein